MNTVRDYIKCGLPVVIVGSCRPTTRISELAFDSFAYKFVCGLKTFFSVDPSEPSTSALPANMDDSGGGFWTRFRRSAANCMQMTRSQTSDNIRAQAENDSGARPPDDVYRESGMHRSHTADDIHKFTSSIQHIIQESDQT